MDLLITSAALGGIAACALMAGTIQLTEWVVDRTGVDWRLVALGTATALGAGVALILALGLSTACYCFDSGPIE